MSIGKELKLFERPAIIYSQETGSEHVSLPVFFDSPVEKMMGQCAFLDPNKYNPLYNLQTMKL